MNNHIPALIEAAERLFCCPAGAILSEDRSQPLVSVRQLAMLVCSDAGYRLCVVADAFERDTRTASSNISRAREYLRGEYPWWLHTKAALIDAWEEALDA